MDEKFSKNLEYILEKKLLTPQKIIEATGHKSTSIVTMWKNGERNIMPLDLIKIANLLNLTIDQLYNQDLRTVLSNANNDNNDDNTRFVEYVKKHVDILTKKDKELFYSLIKERLQQ